jgi:hypothetical protein
LWTLERGLAAGAGLGTLGIAGAIAALLLWTTSGHTVSHETMLRIVLPSLTAVMVSFQLVLGTFFVSILGIRRSGHELPRTADNDPRLADSDLGADPDLAILAATNGSGLPHVRP